MIATMTIQPSRTAQTQERRFSPSANSAGAPLPLIPRRTSSSRPALSCSPSMPLPIRPSTSASSLSSYASNSSSTTVTTLAPPVNDSDSSSTSSLSDGTRPTIRTRRVRGIRTNGALFPPELSTPIPTLTIVSSASQQHVFPSKALDAPQSAPARPLLYTPGISLRSRGVASPSVSESAYVSPLTDAVSQFGSQSASALCDSLVEARMVRKKSGQVVKSSLKSSRSSSRSGSLSVFTTTQASKSEPTTPTSKAVHFDSKLEHVKLFLSEQKPLAVSRDGSPTDDTSGTDSDFPRFIFGTDQSGEHEGRRLTRKKLVMQVTNMPIRVPPYMDNVAIEELVLSPDGASILGKVHVRNLAFSKWIAVRFTFDSWQTTSEVTGKYLDSISPEFDRFSFAIRLNDLLARIESKTLLLAVRYSIEGREMWDNNGGQNYRVTFSKTKVEEPLNAPTLRRSTTLSDDEASTDMMDLRSKLEKVVDTNERTGPAFVQQSSVSTRNSVSPRAVQQYPASADPDTTSFRNSSSFASRYDFSQSLKSSWNPDAHVHAVHNRTQSFPLSRHARSAPWAQTSPSDPYAFRRTPSKSISVSAKALGSPRDLTDVDSFDNALQRQRLTVDTGGSPLQPQPRYAGGRNHQRGYFDLALPSAPLPASLKRTPPGTPRSPLEFDVPLPLPSNGSDDNDPAFDYIDSSDLSTPSMVTPSSSRESTPSPSPTELYGGEPNMSPDTHYRQFLNKYVFLTPYMRFRYVIDFLFCSDSVFSLDQCLRLTMRWSCRGPILHLTSKNSSLACPITCKCSAWTNKTHLRAPRAWTT